MSSSALQRHADLLTPGARDLVEVIGLPATLRLVGRYRGRFLEILKGKSTRGRLQLQELSECVGKIAAEAIIKRYRGTTLVVPKCQKALIASRDLALQARFDALTGAGHSARKAVATMVAEFDLVESSIWRALKRSTGDAVIAARVVENPQFDMFA